MNREHPAEPDPAPPAAAAIGWIGQPPEGGRWGAPGELALPLDDRGLGLGEGLFETVLVQAGRPRLLAEHLERWRQGAALLGLAPPPNGAEVEALLAEAVARSGIHSGALRLNWSGGSGGPGSRGLEASPQPDGSRPERFWLQLTALEPRFAPVSAMVSRWERRNGASRLSRCKTFNYAGQLLARREARLAGADEALLLGSDGNLSCGTAANLLVRLEGRWFTPPLTSGCLPGVMRARALAQGWLQERDLKPRELDRWEGALLLNSLSCRPIHRCEGHGLPTLDPLLPQRHWHRILLPAGQPGG
jgi:branched-subunit amino acid aminotransferase/4-amino-4-deoxychorismate lyase